MLLKQKELDVITELQTQEKNCVEKYRRYKEQARDPELKQLFGRIQQLEQKHFDTLGKVLNGEVPSCDCNDDNGKNYEPKATYDAMGQSEDKQSDNFLVTDCIGTEKMVSSEYNTNVFRFGSAGVRKLLADIQVEEQNHAEMLYKYKTANGMA
ncbi:MAG: ferritin-like domain-containing protein [Lachnospira sp.]|nr:ferritin-like domain-containing protein [Lachnospira sp.]